MEMLQALFDHPQAETAILVVSSAMCLIGLIQVVRKGLALVLWLALFTTGLLPLTYILSGSDSTFFNTARDAVTDARDAAPGFGSNLLRRWCGKLDDACR